MTKQIDIFCQMRNSCTYKEVYLRFASKYRQLEVTGEDKLAVEI